MTQNLYSLLNALLYTPVVICWFCFHVIQIHDCIVQLVWYNHNAAQIHFIILIYIISLICNLWSRNGIKHMLMK